MIVLARWSMLMYVIDKASKDYTGTLITCMGFFKEVAIIKGSKLQIMLKVLVQEPATIKPSLYY